MFPEVGGVSRGMCVSRGCLGGVCVCPGVCVQRRVCTHKLRLRAVIMNLEVNRAPCAKYMDYKNSHDNNIRNLTLK